MGTVTGSAATGPVSGSHTWNMSDTDMQHLLDWMAVFHLADTQQLFSLPPSTTPTNGQFLIMWFQIQMNATMAQVNGWLKSQAAKTASDGVSGIVIS